MKQPLFHQSIFLKPLVMVVLFITLAACSVSDNGENVSDSDDGMASVQVTIPGLETTTKGLTKAAASSTVPPEVTSLLIEVFNQRQRLLASADVIHTNGRATLTIAAGKNYTIRGSAKAGDELLFRGETTVATIAVGSRTAVSLTLADRVQLTLSPLQNSIQIGSGATDFSYSLSGLKNKSLNWYVNGTLGGSAEFGFINASGRYTPPSTLPANTALTIRAEPVAAPSFAQEIVATLAAPANNSAPVATDGTITVSENIEASGTLIAADAEGDPLIFTIVSNGTSGTAFITDPSTGTYTYTPNTDATGQDSFSFRVNDGQADSNSATVTVTITPANSSFDMMVETHHYDPNQLNPFTLTITFPDTVSGFDSTDIILTNATLSSLSSSDNIIYTATIQPTTSGTVTANIPAGSVIDSSGNSNRAAGELRLPFFDWTFIHPSTTTADLESIAIGGGRCVIGGSGGNLSETLSSTSNLIFQRSPIKPVDSGGFQQIHDIAFTQLGGGLYLATGKDGFYSSSDATNWTFNPTIDSLNGEEFYAITEGLGDDNQPLLLAVGNTDNQMRISRDGLSWTTQDYSAVLQSFEYVDLYDVLWDGSRFIAVGHRFQFISFSNNNHGSIILTSPDGVNWSVAYRSFVNTGGFSNTTFDFLLGVTLGEDGNGNPRWLAMGNKGAIVTSSDGINWNAAVTTLGDGTRIEAVKWSVDQFVAVGSDSNPNTQAVILTSPNGIDWTTATLPATAITLNSALMDVDICPGQGNSGQDDIWLAVGKQGELLSSVNGINWTTRNLKQFNGQITHFSEGNNLKLAKTQIGSSNTLYISPNGFNWSTGFTENVVDLSFINAEFFAITRDTNIGNWTLKASSDGISWFERVNVASVFPYPEALLKVAPAVGGELWVLGAANDSSIHLSPDGMNWSRQTLNNTLATPPAAGSSGDRLIAVLNDQLVSSDNGSDWTAFGLPYCGAGCPFSSVKQVLQFGERYLIRGEDFFGEGGSIGKLIYSDDNGQSWSAALTLPGECFYDASVISIEGDLLTYTCGNLFVSIDGVNWIEILAPFSNARLIFSNGGYKLFGDRGGYMTERTFDT